jgi:hypothetical protein
MTGNMDAIQPDHITAYMDASTLIETLCVVSLSCLIWTPAYCRINAKMEDSYIVRTISYTDASMHAVLQLTWTPICLSILLLT